MVHRTLCWVGGEHLFEIFGFDIGTLGRGCSGSCSSHWID
jgi:hypothetical protein